MSSDVDDFLLTVAWSLWTELGVAGVVRHHSDCAVDPEALLIFTADIGRIDRRLRDESLDAALAIAPYIYVTRMKSLLKNASPPSQEAFAPFAEAFNHASKAYVRLPASPTTQRWSATPSGKTRSGPFTAPSQLTLRMRAVFGVGARADILATFIGGPGRGWTALELAESTLLAKRVISSALEDLRRGGIVRATAIGNRLRFDLADPDGLERVAGSVPTHAPAWSSILAFACDARTLLGESTGRNDTALLVDAQRLIVQFTNAQRSRGHVVSAYEPTSWSETRRWLALELERLANGTAPFLGVPARRT